MIELLHSFAAGLCFAFGGVFGVGIAGLYVGRRDAAKLGEVLLVNKRIEERMVRQVLAIERLADTASKIRNSETA